MQVFLGRSGARVHIKLPGQPRCSLFMGEGVAKTPRMGSRQGMEKNLSSIGIALVSLAAVVEED